MNNQLELSKLAPDARIVDAMYSMERSSTEIVLVADDAGQLLGVMTDGDIRRALLKGANLESAIEPYVVQQFFKVGPESGRAEVLDLMRARLIEQVPVVDESGKLCGLHLLHELIGAAERSNWAVIMAGGKGTRLRPITEYLPKPMIPVAGRPILERLVLHLVGHGIRRIYLSINYLGQMVEKHFGDGADFGCQIHYLRETEPLGTGGALGLLPEKPMDPVVMLNGDVVTEANIGAMLEHHARHDYWATMGVREYLHTIPFGCVDIEGGRIVNLIEKPTLSRRINTGIYTLDPRVFDHIESGKTFSITDVFEDCIRLDRPVGAYEIEGDWIDVGQKESLQQAWSGTYSDD